MKKALIIGTILIAGGAAASTPYLIGAHVEKEVHRQFEQMLAKTQLPPEMKMQIDRYERGYRTATAYYTFSIDITDIPQDPATGMPPLPGNITLTMKSEVEHGPFISGAPSPMTLAKFVTIFELNDEFKELERFYFKDKQFFTDIAYLHPDGTSTSEMVIPPYHGPSHDNSAEIKWNGLSGTTGTNWRDLSTKMDVSAPLLEVALGGVNFSVKGTSASTDNWFSPQDITLGTASLKLGEVKVSGVSPADPQAGMTLSNLRVEVDVRQDGTLISGVEEIGFDTLLAGTEQFKNGVIRIELNNLDALTISALQQKIQAHTSSLRAGTDPDIAMNVMLSELQAALPDLLKHSPEFLISKTGVETSKGVIVGRLKLALKPHDQFNPAMGLFALMQILDIEVDLSAPITTVTVIANSMADDQVRAQLAAQQQVMEEEQINQQARMVAQQMLQMGLQQNFIQQHEEDYTVRLRFKNSELKINGQPSDQLINMLMGSAPASGA